MVTSYNTGSPSAQVKLTAIHAGHGGVAHDGLLWRLAATEASGGKEHHYESGESQPTLTIVPGTYHIFAIYKQDEINCGQETFASNTSQDLVFILNDSDLFSTDQQYSAETDPFTEYNRRLADREFELPLGEIVTPVKDPNQKAQMGSQLAAHPLLDNAQFDGIPPQITADPTENEEAANKAELQLQQQLQLQQAAQATPSTSPSPFG